MLHEIENRSFNVCGVDILPVEAHHYKLPVFGYRIGNMAYLTDFKTIEPEEEQKLLNLDVLVVDALRHKEHLSHVSLKETLELIRRVSPKKAYLIHISHTMGLHAKEEPLLPPNVYFGYDGLEVEW
jgi:phosphoribosyl 1,2-cyclic phosphate phosphodiesterase